MGGSASDDSRSGCNRPGAGGVVGQELMLQAPATATR